MKNILFILTLLISFNSFAQNIQDLNSETDIKNWIDKNSKDEIEGIWVFTAINSNTDEKEVYLKAAILRADEQSKRESFQSIMIECYNRFIENCEKQNLVVGDFLDEIKKQHDGLYEFQKNGKTVGWGTLKEGALSIDYSGLLVSVERAYHSRPTLDLGSPGSIKTSGGVIKFNRN